MPTTQCGRVDEAGQEEGLTENKATASRASGGRGSSLRPSACTPCPESTCPETRETPPRQSGRAPGSRTHRRPGWWGCSPSQQPRRSNLPRETLSRGKVRSAGPGRGPHVAAGAEQSAGKRVPGAGSDGSLPGVVDQQEMLRAGAASPEGADSEVQGGRDISTHRNQVGSWEGAGLRGKPSGIYKRGRSPKKNHAGPAGDPLAAPPPARAGSPRGRRRAGQGGASSSDRAPP